MQVIRFFMNNWQTILLIYGIVAVVVFGLMVAFWVWIIKADNKEQTLYPEEYEELDGNIILPIGIATVTSLGCAVLWVVIPVLIAGLLFYDWIQRKYPDLMGNAYESIEEDNDND